MQFDEDGDGMLSKEELTKMGEQMGCPPQVRRLDPAEIQREDPAAQ